MKKKIVFSLMAITSLILMIFSGCDFRNNEQTEFESGDFIYTYVNRAGANGMLSEGKYIAILQLSEEGKKKETIIIPEEIDGKPVVQIGMTGMAYSYSTLDGNTKFTRMYLPSTLLCVGVSEYSVGGFNFSIKLDKKLLTNNGGAIYNSDWIYVCQEVYEKYKDDDITNVLQIANLNYYIDGEIYWIDNSPYSVICEMKEFEPPTPTKVGYKFAGWYKEPECINRWIYGVDVFPNREDENGNLNMVNLYAGWEKI